MTLEFSNTVQDFILAHEYIDRNKPSERFRLYTVPKIIMPIFFMICILFSIYLNNLYHTIRVLVIALFVGTGAIFIAPKLWINSRNKVIKNWEFDKPELFALKKITFEDQTLICTTKFKSIKFSLNLFEKIVEENDLIYIFGSNYNLYLVIPVSSFSSIEEKNLFIDKVKGLN